MGSPLNSFIRYCISSCLPIGSFSSSMKLKLQRSTLSLVGVPTLHRNTDEPLAENAFHCKAHLFPECCRFEYENGSMVVIAFKKAT
uniref:Uncharacterized protein n=1 Tax=Anguilla anguilla TaxID=7936 RepID=A0A0E9SF33_ANGAN